MTDEIQLDLIQDNLNNIRAIALFAKTRVVQRGVEGQGPEEKHSRAIQIIVG